MYYIGYDIGSSSIKASIVEINTGKCIGVTSQPEMEMPIISENISWAEQHPDTWWEHICKATGILLKKYEISAEEIKGIGLSYQMHGLVLIDRGGKPIRNSIIWCDGRAVEIGDKAFEEIGKPQCLDALLNSPANFTASKLRWVKLNEPEVYEKAYKLLLPGDYIAYKFSGQINTTVPGLSEGIFWDFKNSGLATWLLEYYDLDPSLIPDIVPTFSQQSCVSAVGEKESGLKEGTPIYYRAGDQPNNALSLNVFQPGEVAATGGTSGVFYAISDVYSALERSGVNNFAHVTHSAAQPRIGKLLCINGAGIQYRWLLNNLEVSSYEEMNELASKIPIGSHGLLTFPYGNGPERMFNNKNPGAGIRNLNFNIHNKAHLCRSALEGIAFSFVYGMELLKHEGVQPEVIRAGNDNLFRSEIFSQTIANLLQQEIELFNNTGATGAARACSLRNGDFESFGKQVMQQDYLKSFRPDKDKDKHLEAYQNWRSTLKSEINK